MQPIISICYVELCDTVERQIQEEQADPDKYWTYKRIIDHQGPLTSSSEDWKGSTYNVLVQWEDGSKHGSR